MRRGEHEGVAAGEDHLPDRGRGGDVVAARPRAPCRSAPADRRTHDLAPEAEAAVDRAHVRALRGARGRGSGARSRRGRSRSSPRGSARSCGSCRSSRASGTNWRAMGSSASARSISRTISGMIATASRSATCASAMGSAAGASPASRRAAIDRGVRAGCFMAAPTAPAAARTRPLPARPAGCRSCWRGHEAPGTNAAIDRRPARGRARACGRPSRSRRWPSAMRWRSRPRWCG